MNEPTKETQYQEQDHQDFLLYLEEEQEEFLWNSEHRPWNLYPRPRKPK
jgi:hypothetical protein